MNKEEFRASLGVFGQRPVAFLPGLARAVGGVKAGLFLCQLLYWQDRGSKEGGWVYKDWRDWEEETCLTQDEQRGARRELLALGVIEESDVRRLKIDQFKSTLAHRIDFDKLYSLLFRVEEQGKEAG